MKDFIFGIPFYRTIVDPVLFNKQELVKVIEENYNKDKNRNNWDKDSLSKSNLHHAYNDWFNEDFKKLNLS